MLWSAPKMWDGETVYILGGGPSLLDNNLTLIHDKKCIGVNNSAFLGEWVDVCWFGDMKWWNWHRDRLRKYWGMVVTCNPKMKDWARIKVLLRGKSQGIETRPNYVAWNRNSGSSAINLAYHFGAKKIVLLGFDMRRIDGKKNWHNEHKEREHNPFARHMMSMPTIRKELQDLGVELINATKDSAITCLPYLSLEEVVGPSNLAGLCNPHCGQCQPSVSTNECQC